MGDFSSILEAVRANAQHAPELVACRFLDRSGNVTSELTRGACTHAVRCTAQALHERGIRGGDRVLLFLPTGSDFVVVFLALLSLGGVPVPLPEIPQSNARGAAKERIIGVAADCQPSAAIVDSPAGSEQLRGLGVSLPAWVAGDLTQPAEGSGAISIAAPFDAERAAFLQYTSGTTGTPKGVVISQRALNANLQAMRDAISVGPNDVGLSWLPLHHDMGLVGGLLLSLYTGCPVYLAAPSLFLGGPAFWLRSISRYRVTISPGTNFAYQLCARRLSPERLGALDLSCWRIAFTGAETVHARTLRRFAERFESLGFSARAFLPVYGLAEATLAVTFPAPAEGAAVDRVQRRSLGVGRRAEPAEGEEADAIEVVALGRALRGVEVSIVDPETRAPCAERVVGEVVVGGDSLYSGYYREWSAPDFIPQHTLNTGDLGYFAQGQVHIVDRIRDLIKIAGISYFPSDIERTVSDVVGVKRVAAFDVPDDDAGSSALALVIEASMDAEACARIEAEARRLLLAHNGLAPRQVHFVGLGSIPLTSSGKVQRRRTKELILTGSL